MSHSTPTASSFAPGTVVRSIPGKWEGIVDVPNPNHPGRVMVYQTRAQTRHVLENRGEVVTEAALDSICDHDAGLTRTFSYPYSPTSLRAI